MLVFVTSFAPVSTRFSTGSPCIAFTAIDTPMYPMFIGFCKTSALISPAYSALTNLEEASKPTNFTLPASFASSSDRSMPKVVDSLQQKMPSIDSEPSAFLAGQDVFALLLAFAVAPPN